MAGRFRRAQASMRSSGTEAPSRKLNADRAWSSMYIAGGCLSRPLAGPLR